MGHAWFADHAFTVAVPVAVAAGTWLAFHSRRRSLDQRLSDAVVNSCTLVLLMLIPQWVEGELTAGHGVTFDSLRDCGLATIIVAYCAVYAWTIVSWARLVGDTLRFDR